jgi:hypothetical protein
VSVQTPESRRTRARCHLRINKTVASGTNTLEINVWGRQTRAEDSSGVEQSDDVWCKIFGTGALSSGGTGAIRDSYLLHGAQDYEELTTEVATNGGGTPSLDTWFAFVGSDPE